MDIVSIIIVSDRLEVATSLQITTRERIEGWLQRAIRTVRKKEDHPLVVRILFSPRTIAIVLAIKIIIITTTTVKAVAWHGRALKRLGCDVRNVPCYYKTISYTMR